MRAQAPPTIADAFDACVADGASTVVVSPYFLSPGRHWQEDIPTLAAAAAARHPGVRYLVAAPLGLHPLVSQARARRPVHAKRLLKRRSLAGAGVARAALLGTCGRQRAALRRLRGCRRQVQPALWRGSLTTSQVASWLYHARS